MSPASIQRSGQEEVLRLERGSRCTLQELEQTVWAAFQDQQLGPLGTAGAQWSHIEVRRDPLNEGSNGVQLAEEFAALRYQSGTSSSRGGRRYRPFAFTEQGVAMLSSVLRSHRAVLVNVEIMRAFVRLRQLLDSHAELARKLAALERRYDTQFKVVFDAIRALMAPPAEPPKRIGFQNEDP